MVIFLPIETKVRELDGKILLAARLAMAGHTTIIGPKRELNSVAVKYKPSIYIGDSGVARKNKIELYSKLHEIGTKVIILDTEGGLFISEELFKKRLDERVLKYTSRYYSWGPKVKSIIGGLGSFPEEKVVVTGNPKFDLTSPYLRKYYDNDIRKLSSKYGKYIMVNTNFSRANHFDNEILYKTSLSDLSDGRMEYGKKLFNYFIEMLLDVSDSFKNINFVVRPHPSENHDFYKLKFKGRKNVYVVHEGDVYPWILASEFVLHNSCTTGIEATLLDVPALTYQPIEDERFDLQLPNQVSDKAKSIGEVKEYITNFKESVENIRSERGAIMSDFINNIYGESCDIICEDIESAFDNVLEEKGSMLDLSVTYAKDKLRSMLTRNSNGLKYDLQKFPFLTKEEVRSRVETIKYITQISDKISVKPFAPLKNSFEIKLES